jgi:hypothetical protein
LNEHSIGVGRNDTSDTFSERLGFAAQKRDTLLSQSSRRRIDVRYAKRNAIDSYMIQSRLNPAQGREFQHCTKSMNILPVA